MIHTCLVGYTAVRALLLYGSNLFLQRLPSLRTSAERNGTGMNHWKSRRLPLGKLLEPEASNQELAAGERQGISAS